MGSIWPLSMIYWGFSFSCGEELSVFQRWCLPGSSAGKEFTCNAGDPSSIPGLGRSSGERIGYPLQYSWASLVAQLVKNPPAMWDTWVWSLDLKDPLGEVKGYPLQGSGLENSMDCIVHGVTKSPTQLTDFHSQDMLNQWVMIVTWRLNTIYWFKNLNVNSGLV